MAFTGQLLELMVQWGRNKEIGSAMVNEFSKLLKCFLDEKRATFDLYVATW